MSEPFIHGYHCVICGEDLELDIEFQELLCMDCMTESDDGLRQDSNAVSEKTPLYSVWSKAE